MEVHVFIFLFLVALTNLVRGLMAEFSQTEKLSVKDQLNMLNKPAVKTFLMEYGEKFDCVEINKQLAFDHPLLKNHSIQMKPSMKIKSNGPSSEIIQTEKIKCPPGTVVIKRVEKEDLIAMKKFKASMATKFSISTSTNQSNDQFPTTDHKASIIAFTKNYGVTGSINVWSPEIKDNDQFSSASVFVASDDVSVSNGILAGWSVNPYIYKNFTRLNTFWTRDSAQKTGCFNTICPGFVQTSQNIPLGFIIKPVSQYDGTQYAFNVTIEEDESTKNWWLTLQGNPVGYWPKELFTTLTQGATRAGWGGEVSSPEELGTPAMGSGHFPIEGFKKACFIRQMSIADSSHIWVPPSDDYLKQLLTNPLCFKASYDGLGRDKDWGNFMYFGGPPNCKI